MGPLEALGNEIKCLRLQKGLSQDGLAYLTELHRTYISNVENGSRNLSILNLIKIANALKVTPSELIKCINTTQEDYNEFL